jgi:hypothetical protein
MTTKKQLIQKQHINLIKTATTMNDLKKKELPLLQQAIVNCLKLKGSIFQDAMLENNERIEHEVKRINEAKIKPSEGLTAYLKERDELKRSHTRKDEKNEPIILTDKNGATKYDVIDLDVLEAELLEFDVLNQIFVDEQKEIEIDFDLLLDKDSECKLIKIDRVDLPKDIDGIQLAGIRRHLLNKPEYK